MIGLHGHIFICLFKIYALIFLISRFCGKVRNTEKKDGKKRNVSHYKPNAGGTGRNKRGRETRRSST